VVLGGVAGQEQRTVVGRDSHRLDTELKVYCWTSSGLDGTDDGPTCVEGSKCKAAIDFEDVPSKRVIAVSLRTAFQNTSFSKQLIDRAASMPQDFRGCGAAPSSRVCCRENPGTGAR
jgi:hypothetical protein